MPDTPIVLDNAVQDDGLIDAFNSGRAERGGRRRVPAATDPNPARLLPSYVSAGPRHVVSHAESGQRDAANPTAD